MGLDRAPVFKKALSTHSYFDLVRFFIVYVITMFFYIYFVLIVFRFRFDFDLMRFSISFGICLGFLVLVCVSFVRVSRLFSGGLAPSWGLLGASRKS